MVRLRIICAVTYQLKLPLQRLNGLDVWRYMKYLLIALFAFSLTLGVGCKKDEGFEPKSKIEIKKAEGEVKEEGDPEYGGGGTIGTNPFGLPHVHASIPRNSVHSPVWGYRNGTTYTYICSGNGYTFRECTLFP